MFPLFPLFPLFPILSMFPLFQFFPLFPLFPPFSIFPLFPVFPLFPFLPLFSIFLCSRCFPYFRFCLKVMISRSASGFESPTLPNEIATDSLSTLGQERHQIYGPGDFGPLKGLRAQGGRMYYAKEQNKKPTLHFRVEPLFPRGDEFLRLPFKKAI